MKVISSCAYLVSGEDLGSDNELNVAELLDKGVVLEQLARLHARTSRAEILERLGRALLILIDGQVLDRIVALFIIITTARQRLSLTSRALSLSCSS
jgi:hypothetical protein